MEQKKEKKSRTHFSIKNLIKQIHLYGNPVFYVCFSTVCHGFLTGMLF